MDTAFVVLRMRRRASSSGTSRNETVTVSSSDA